MTMLEDVCAKAGRRAYTIDTFCETYGIGRSLVYREFQSGRLRCRKVGKRTLITSEDAEAWLEQLPEGVGDDPVRGKRTDAA